MCRLKSCLVLKDRVFCPDYDSHQQMLEKLGIEDNYLHASKTFVRVELLPPNTNTRSLREPLDKWTLKVDQDVTPEWWDEKADRPRVEEAVEAWRAGHVFTEGEHIVTAGEVYAFGSATVEACGSATVTAYNSATVKAYDSAAVIAYDSVTVEAYNSDAVDAYGRATVKAYGVAKVEIYNNVTAEAYDNAKVSAYDSTRVKAWNGATVKAYDNAIAI